MDAEPEMIKQDIDRTRESLSVKVGALEDHIKDTIHSVTEKVEDTIDTVKTKVEGTVQAVTHTVESTVEGVKRTFDIPYQVRRHPYGMAGGALVAGAALGWWVGNRRGHHHEQRPRPSPAAYRAPAPEPTARTQFQQQQQGQSWLGRMLEPLAGEMDRIKGMAVGALLGMARDVVSRSLPESLKDKVEEIFDNVTRNAGGSVVSGPVLQREEDGHPAHEQSFGGHQGQG